MLSRAVVMAANMQSAPRPIAASMKRCAVFSVLCVAEVVLRGGGTGKTQRHIPPTKQSTPTRKLESALKPVTLNIIDESHKHAGHSGNPSGAPDAETHFR